VSSLRRGVGGRGSPWLGQKYTRLHETHSICWLSSQFHFICMKFSLCSGASLYIDGVSGCARYLWDICGPWALCLLPNSALWAMSNYQMNCAIIYFCLLIGCRSNEPNDQISESRYVPTSILYAHGMSQRLLRLPPDMANINVMTYVAPMRCDAMRLPYLFDLSTYLRRRQVAKLRLLRLAS